MSVPFPVRLDVEWGEKIKLGAPFSVLPLRVFIVLSVASVLARYHCQL